MKSVQRRQKQRRPLCSYVFLCAILGSSLISCSIVKFALGQLFLPGTGLPLVRQNWAVLADVIWSLPWTIFVGRHRPDEPHVASAMPVHITSALHNRGYVQHNGPPVASPAIPLAVLSEHLSASRDIRFAACCARGSDGTALTVSPAVQRRTPKASKQVNRIGFHWTRSLSMPSLALRHLGWISSTPPSIPSVTVSYYQSSELLG